MAKDAITDYSTVAADNTDIGGVGISGTNAASNMDNAVREWMTHAKEMNDGTSPLHDTFCVADPADLTKKARLDCGSVTAGNTRVLTVPNFDGTIATLAGTETFTNKTLTSPVLTTPQINDTSSDHQYIFAGSELTADRTVTLPLLTGGDTFVFAAHTQTLTNKTLTDPAITGCILEDVYTISDGAAFEIDPGNGAIQFVTLGANRTPAATNFANGEAVTLRVNDGSAFTITWTTVNVVWKDATAPTLATSGYTEIHLEKAGDVIRGVHVGDFAS